MEAAKIFFKNTVERIINGEFDQYMDMPFMSKHVLVSMLRAKIDKRMESGGTPVVSDNEIMLMIDDVRELAAYTYLIFKETGVLEESEEGLRVSEQYSSRMKK